MRQTGPGHMVNRSSKGIANLQHAVHSFQLRPPEKQAPKHVLALISRAYEYVAIHGKGDFANVIKLRILSWEYQPQ